MIKLKFFLHSHKKGVRRTVIATVAVALAVLIGVNWPTHQPEAKAENKTFQIEEETLRVEEPEDVILQQSPTWEVRDADDECIRQTLIDEDEYAEIKNASTPVVEIQKTESTAEAKSSSEENPDQIYSVSKETIMEEEVAAGVEPNGETLIVFVEVEPEYIPSNGPQAEEAISIIEDNTLIAANGEYEWDLNWSIKGVVRHFFILKIKIVFL